MGTMVVPTESGEPGLYDDESGLVTVEGEPPRPLTERESAMVGATVGHGSALLAQVPLREAVYSAAQALTAALEVTEAGPLDDAGRAQVDAALTQYRALPPVPPADVVDLATRVSAAVQSNGYARAVEARNAHMSAEQAFVYDATVSHAQLVAHVRELTRRVWDLRGGA